MFPARTGHAGRARPSDGSALRQVMERAMLSAIASQMGLPEGDPRVHEVFDRESRLLAEGST